MLCSLGGGWSLDALSHQWILRILVLLLPSLEGFEWSDSHNLRSHQAVHGAGVTLPTRGFSFVLLVSEDPLTQDHVINMALGHPPHGAMCSLYFLAYDAGVGRS